MFNMFFLLLGTIHTFDSFHLNWKDYFKTVPRKSRSGETAKGEMG